MTDLFTWQDALPAHQRHSPTSKAAAASIKPRIGPLHRLILRRLQDCGNMTDEEMQVEMGMSANTQRPRRRELQVAGLIVDTGKTRKTRSGRAAVVWSKA